MCSHRMSGRPRPGRGDPDRLEAPVGVLCERREARSFYVLTQNEWAAPSRTGSRRRWVLCERMEARSFYVLTQNEWAPQTGPDRVEAPRTGSVRGVR